MCDARLRFLIGCEQIWRPGTRNGNIWQRNMVTVINNRNGHTKSSTHSNLIQWNNYERYCFLLLPILLTTWCINRQVFSFWPSRPLIAYAYIASIQSPLMVTLITTRIAHLSIVHTVKFWQIFPHSMLMTFYPISYHETLSGDSARKMLLLLYQSFFFMTYYFNRFYHFASSCERRRLTQKFCGRETRK